MLLPILPGYRFWQTLAGSSASVSLPADFFAPGSDPFVGSFAVIGSPTGPGAYPPPDSFFDIFTSHLLDPPIPGLDLNEVDARLGGGLAATDTIVQRLAGLSLPNVGDAGAIPIEIVGLSLVSVAPITVTFGGGGSPSLWDVTVGLDPGTHPQPPGIMQIQRTSENGGTFVAQLPVVAQFTFVRQQSTQPPVATVIRFDLTGGGELTPPEPGTIVLVAGGLGLLAIRRRWARAK